MMVQNGQIFKVCPSSLFHQNEVGNLRLDMKLFSIWYLCAKIMQSQNEFSSLENGYQKLHFFTFVSAHCPDATSPQAHPNYSLSFTTKRRQKLSESFLESSILHLSICDRRALPNLILLSDGQNIFSKLIFQFSNDHNFHHRSLQEVRLSFLECFILHISI